MMTMSAKPLSPPTPEEREKAREAAAVLRAGLADPAALGTPQTMHIDLSRPRRGEWWTTYKGAPGLTRIQANARVTYRHDLLPGWEYLGREIEAEMIPDLEALAERGERPAEASR